MQYYAGDAGSSLETLLTNQRVQEARCLSGRIVASVTVFTCVGSLTIIPVP